MISLLALLRDSFRQTVDNKVFVVLLIIFSVVILLCLVGVRYTDEGITILLGIKKIEYKEMKFPDSQTRRSISLAGIPGEELRIAFVYATLNGVQGVFSGFFGFVLAIIVTSFFIPEMLQKGSIDLLLSRPISRATGFRLGGPFSTCRTIFSILTATWRRLACRVSCASVGRG